MFSYSDHCQGFRYSVNAFWSAQSLYSYFEFAFRPDCQHRFPDRKENWWIADASDCLRASRCRFYFGNWEPCEDQKSFVWKIFRCCQLCLTLKALFPRSQCMIQFCYGEMAKISKSDVFLDCSMIESYLSRAVLLF